MIILCFQRFLVCADHFVELHVIIVATSIFQKEKQQKEKYDLDIASPQGILSRPFFLPISLLTSSIYIYVFIYLPINLLYICISIFFYLTLSLYLSILILMVLLPLLAYCSRITETVCAVFRRGGKYGEIWTVCKNGGLKSVQFFLSCVFKRFLSYFEGG